MSGNATPPTISVLMPVYNSAKFVTEALDSLLVQTYEDFEIVCVDDGSTDGSAELLDDYALRDGRMRVFHQQNAGAAAARNFALDQARGLYLCFMDSDDFVEPSMLRELMDRMEQHDPELVLFDVDMYRQQEAQFVPSGAIKQGMFPVDTPFAPYQIKGLYRNMRGYTVGRLYRTSYVRDMGVRFPSISAHEDMPFSYVLFSGARKVVFVDKALYHYRIHGTDTVTQRSNATFVPMFEALEEFRRGLELRGLWQVYEQEFENYFMHMLMWKHSINEPFVQQKMAQALNEDWFERLGVGWHEDDYYYSGEELALLRTIQDQL